MESRSLPQLLSRLAALLRIHKTRKGWVRRKDQWYEDTRPTARVIYLDQKEALPVTGPAKVIPMYN